MKRISLGIATLVCLTAFGTTVARAQYDKSATPASSKMAASKGEAKLTATLVDPDAKAKEKAATVKVTVIGVRLVDPALAHEKPVKGQAHLHYQVDDGPIVATPAPKLSFHNLSSGSHKITVTLAANDHNPLGPSETLNVTIP